MISTSSSSSSTPLPLQAVRQNRYVILSKDFDKAYKKHVNKADKEHMFYTM
jgi:26S proteasome regulatory subunit T3